MIRPLQEQHLEKDHFRFFQVVTAINDEVGNQDTDNAGKTEIVNLYDLSDIVDTYFQMQIAQYITENQ